MAISIKNAATGAVSTPQAASRRTARSYDDGDYNYLAYWNGRRYEHRAEVIALRRLLRGRRFAHALDVGGGFGRLSKVLCDYASRVTLADASLRQLELARQYMAGRGQAELRLMDAAHLELDDASVDLAVMVRVLHHIPFPAGELAEMARVLKPGGYAVIEAANSLHAVNRVRSWAHGRRIPADPLDVRSLPNRTSDSIPFVNHHPRMLTRQLSACGLRIERRLSVSNLRQPLMKRAMPTRMLLGAEYLMQVPLAPLHFGPSLFFLARREQPLTGGRHRRP
jgi:SAM-dependent methyltransferase